MSAVPRGTPLVLARLWHNRFVPKHRGRSSLLEGQPRLRLRRFLCFLLRLCRGLFFLWLRSSTLQHKLVEHLAFGQLYLAPKKKLHTEYLVGSFGSGTFTGSSPASGGQSGMLGSKLAALTAKSGFACAVVMVGRRAMPARLKHAKTRVVERFTRDLPSRRGAALDGCHTPYEHVEYRQYNSK